MMKTNVNGARKPICFPHYCIHKGLQINAATYENNPRTALAESCSSKTSQQRTT